MKDTACYSLSFRVRLLPYATHQSLTTMNTALKYWREAATVILAAGCKLAPAAATGARSRGASAVDYKVLLLKRHGQSGFMPNAYVFPGGLVEAADFSRDWTDIFKPFKHLPNFGVPVVKQAVETRPPMFATDRAEFGSPVPGDVALRICAVRETFEESGVLLVVPASQAEHIYAAGHDHPSLAAVSERWDSDLVDKWRALVIENSANFARMCTELECLPNIWALHEWGNWLTPVRGSAKQRRYDTAFYICCLQDVPHTAQDQKEILHYEWSSPPDILHSFRNREFWIAPPQLYDLGRLCNYPSLKELHAFAKLRSVEGCEQWLPVFLAATDGSVSLLPGDSLYPKNIDTSGKISVTLPTGKSLEELQRDSPNLHRIVFNDLYTTSVHINITPKYKHLPPVSSSARDVNSNESKL